MNDAGVPAGNIHVVDDDVAVAAPSDDCFVARYRMNASHLLFNPDKEEGFLFSGRCFHDWYTCLSKGFQRAFLIREILKNSQQLGHLEKILGARGQLQQPYVALFTADCGVAGDQLAEAGTIDMTDVS